MVKAEVAQNKNECLPMLILQYSPNPTANYSESVFCRDTCGSLCPSELQCKALDFVYHDQIVRFFAHWKWSPLGKGISSVHRQEIDSLRPAILTLMRVVSTVKEIIWDVDLHDGSPLSCSRSPWTISLISPVWAGQVHGRTYFFLHCTPFLFREKLLLAMSCKIK